MVEKIKKEYLPQAKFVVLPRVGAQANRKRKFDSSRNKTMNVVFPNHVGAHSNSAYAHSRPTQVKKEFLGSTKAPENSFAALCNTILAEIYQNSQNNFDVIYQYNIIAWSHSRPIE